MKLINGFRLRKGAAFPRSLYIFFRHDLHAGNHPGATAPPLLIQEGSSYKLPSSDEEGWRPGRRGGVEQEM